MVQGLPLVRLVVLATIPPLGAAITAASAVEFGSFTPRMVMGWQKRAILNSHSMAASSTIGVCRLHKQPRVIGCTRLSSALRGGC